MFLQIWQFVTAHWLLSALFGLIAYVLMVALIQQIRFHVWYLLVLVVGAIIAKSAGYPVYFAPFLLGMATAFAEIISKFDDEPMKALKTFPALTYHILNGLIAVFALYLLALTAGIPIDFDKVSNLDKLKYAMAAGFGAMLIMRSKLFNIKVGDDNVSFGPEQIINIVFRFMESAIGRARASERRAFIEQKLNDIDFTKVYEHSMMTLRRALRLHDDDKALVDLREVKEAFDKLPTPQPSGEIQLCSYELGYVVYDIMGEEFVSQLFSNPRSEWLLRAPAPEPTKTGILPTLIEVEPESALAKLPFINAKPEYYLAYGTNMSSRWIRERLDWMEASGMDKLQNTSRKLAVLDGFRLAFNGVKSDVEGLANLVIEPGGKVQGVLYELPKKAIEFLEEHEPGYHRLTVQVAIPGENKQVQATALVADKIGPEQPPNSAYLTAMLEGGKENGLSPGYMNQWNVTKADLGTEPATEQNGSAIGNGNADGK